MFRMETAGLTDVGRLRKNNEDSFSIADPLLIVADGMGGAAAGEIASSLAVETVSRMLKNLTFSRDADVSKKILNAICEADKQIKQKSRSQSNLSGMGTTMVMAVHFDSRIVIGNVGDSRAYIISQSLAGATSQTPTPDIDTNALTAILQPVSLESPDNPQGSIRRISEDHSVVMDLVRSGVIEEKEIRSHPLRNRITKCIGSLGNRESGDTVWYDLKDGDVLILCTDGLWEMMHEDVMYAIVNTSSSMEDACKRLVDTANNAGGSDNITVITAQFTKT